MAFKKLGLPQTHSWDRSGKENHLTLFYKTFKFMSDKILHWLLSNLWRQRNHYGSSSKIIGNSKGVMAGGDLRLNTRKLKVRALPNLWFCWSCYTTWYG
jgi:large subunit ribosomal protein L25